MFLMGDAVTCAKTPQKTPDGYYNLERMLKGCEAKEVAVGCCGTCLDARGMTDDPLATPARRSTLAELTEWTIWADKVDHVLEGLTGGLMARILVLGAGFGGIAAATRLRSLLDPAHEVVLVDRRSDFVMGLRKTWAVLGSHPLDEGRRGLATLREHGIDVRQATVEAIDAACPPRAGRRRVARGRRHGRGLGAEQAPHAVPGLAEHGINVWDRANAARAHDALAALDRGRLLVGVFGTPYACPPGPFELALLAQEALAARGADVSVEVFGPMPIALPVVGPAESAKVEALLEAAGIPFHRGQPATSVEAGVVHLADGRDLAFDLLLAIAPHRVPQVLIDAGLAQPGGWVEIDPRTLATPFPAIYAIGDSTVIKLAHGLPLPKAGLFAEAEGYVVAERIAAELARSRAIGDVRRHGAVLRRGRRGPGGRDPGPLLRRPARRQHRGAVGRCHDRQGGVRDRPPRGMVRPLTQGERPWMTRAQRVKPG